MKIGVDIDNVLADLITSLVAYHNNKYGTNFKEEDFKVYSLLQTFKGTEEEIRQKIKEFYTTNYFKNVKPINGAVEFIEKLSQEHDLILITDRPHHLSKITREWVEKYFPKKFSEINFTNRATSNNTASKYTVCSKRRVKFLIDDNLEHARECANKGIKVFLFDKPWNQTEELHEGIERFNSWDAILPQFND